MADPQAPPDLCLQIGDQLYGYCGGKFGRDTYREKRVEAIGVDWVVVRESWGVNMFEGDPDSLVKYTAKPPDRDDYMPLPHEGFNFKTEVRLPSNIMELGARKVLAPLLEVIAQVQVQAHWAPIRALEAKLDEMGYRGILRGPEVQSFPDHGLTKMESTVIPKKKPEAP